MSIQALSYVFENSNQKGSALLLLLAIADSANGEDWSCYPGVSYLAKKVRMSERYIQMLEQKLINSNELEVDMNDGKFFNGGKTNRYYVLERRKRHVQIEFPEFNPVKPASPRGVNPSSPGVVKPASPDPLVVTVSKDSKDSHGKNFEGLSALPSSNINHPTWENIETFKGEDSEEKIKEQPELAKRISSNYNPPSRLKKEHLARLKTFSARYDDNPVYRNFIAIVLRGAFFPGETRIPWKRDTVVDTIVSDKGWPEYEKTFDTSIGSGDIEEILNGTL